MTIPLQRALGATVRKLRQERGLTLDAFARLIKSHRPVVSRLEKGTHPPNFRTLVVYAEFFGLRPSELLAMAEREPPAEVAS